MIFIRFPVGVRKLDALDPSAIAKTEVKVEDGMVIFLGGVLVVFASGYLGIPQVIGVWEMDTSCAL